MPIVKSEPSGSRVHQIAPGTVEKQRRKTASEVLDAQEATKSTEGSASSAASESDSGPEVSGATEDSATEVSTKSSSDSSSDEKHNPTVVALYRPDCVKCGHLVPTEKQVKVKCHWTRGNDECPAKHFVLKQTIPKEYIAKNLAKYMVNGDIEGYQRVSQKLVEASRKNLITAAEFKEVKDMEAAEIRKLRGDEA